MFNPYLYLPPLQNQIDSNIYPSNAMPLASMARNEQNLLQNVYLALNSQQQIFKEIDEIRSQIKQLKEKNTQYIQTIARLQKQKKQLQMDKKGKKIFKKNIYCPFQTCGNKYSSKIALNSHIRAKHKKRDDGSNREQIASSNSQLV